MLKGIAAPIAACAFAKEAAPAGGTAALLDLKRRRVLSIQNAEEARRLLCPPGSTLKPLSLLALMDAGKLRAEDEFVCPGTLTLGGRQLNCSHPVSPLPMNPSRAIAYSCNCAVAHFALRFTPGELAQALTRDGLAAMTGLADGPEAAGTVRVESGMQQQLQALGEESVLVTPLGLLNAYAILARRVSDRTMAPVLEGLEGAVEFGTAQRASLPRVRIAGKTGTARMQSGRRAAWFAGFAPSRSPEVAIVVLVQGRSGGSDAAPVAGDILRDYFGARA